MIGTFYLVMDDLRDRHGRVWRDAYPETTGLETVITDLLKCQYNNPVRVVAFNTAECRAHDVSEDIARECAGAATSSWPSCRNACRTSSRALRLAIESGPRCAWSMTCLYCEDEGWVCETRPDQSAAAPTTAVAVVARHALPEMQSIEGVQSRSQRPSLGQAKAEERYVMNTPVGTTSASC